MIHGLLMAAAIDAAAPSDADVKAPERTDSFGRTGSVVLGEIIAARAVTPGPGYAVGGIGGLGAAPSYFSAGWVSFGSTRSGDLSTRTISAEPSFDVFVGKGVSIGGLLGGGITKWESTGPSPAMNVEQWHLTAMPRIGETFALTKDISLWTRFAAGVTLTDSPAQEKVGTTLRATFDVPFVFAVSRHVMLQAGPQLSYFHQLSGFGDARGFSGGASGGLSILL